jgi:RHS repeat-associated protein
VATSYLHDGRNPATVNGDFLLSGLGLDENYARISSSSTTGFFADALGSTVALTDGSATVTANYTYEPYGATAKAGSDDTSFQYTGRENDGSTKLYYYRARYYSPQLGRFISQDPIGFRGGINSYAYADGDPVSETDPTGDCPWCVAAVIGGLTDLTIQPAFNGFDTKCVNWSEVLISAAASGVGVGRAQKFAKVSTVLKGASRPTYRYLKIKDVVRIESHPPGNAYPDWFSYPHWHPDAWGKPWSKMHWPLVEPAVGVPAAAYNAGKDGCGLPIKSEFKRDVFLEFLNRLQYVRARPIKGTSVFKIEEAKALWNKGRSEDEKRELLRLLCLQFPVAAVLLDPMDEDIQEELSGVEGVEQRGRALILPSERIPNASKRLYRGNWVLFLFASMSAGPEVFPSEVPTEPRALQDMLSQIGASVAIVSEPDDSDWLLALRGYDDRP